MAPSIILHHYAGSPFAEKIRLALDLKGLQWFSVEHSNVMPRPLLEPLAHGYRRIPVLQIGQDVYCDTSLILDILEERQVPLYPKGTPNKGWIKAFSLWTDGPFFQLNTSLLPWGKLNEQFLKDREQFVGRKIRQADPATTERITSTLAAHYAVLDSILSDGRQFLAGEQPTLADVHGYMHPWFLLAIRQGKDMLGPDLKNYPHMAQWMKRVKETATKRKHAQSYQKLDPSKAIDLAEMQSKVPSGQGERPFPIQYSLGSTISVTPDDTGRVPVKGKVVFCSNERIAIRPYAVSGQGVDTRVWFPRMGYSVQVHDAKL
ncbi:hypothetical protein BZG36_00740 [Bifiguratus adelaidae]|uniref:GST N-terminal domain-containing protein n=1 Tax=Bifiguratus adelaidae TaxID=1938954 RepID=A0A261Y6T7_9FUNG|nr:hypothetical protein BZG36_00740 [Bifiguratus adelaidae]